jgi:predicted nuclease with TOPRIM domain
LTFKNAEVVKSMLFQLRKENIELNDEYNKMFEEKTRLKAQYQKMKEKIEKFEEIEKQEHESLDVSVRSVRNTSNSIVISDFIISKKLFDSSIFIDEKDSNIED